MELFQESISSLNLEETADEDVNKKIAAKAIEIVDKYQSESKRVPGYGHRYHDKDPRAVRLLDLAILESSIGPHTKLALVIESILSDRKGICLNVDGVNAGLLSDLGFDSSMKRWKRKRNSDASVIWKISFMKALRIETLMKNNYNNYPIILWRNKHGIF